MAATVATNDQGQIPLVERPQGLLGERELLLLLHDASSLFLRLCGHEAHDSDRRERLGKSPPRASARKNSLPLPRRLTPLTEVILGAVIGQMADLERADT